MIEIRVPDARAVTDERGFRSLPGRPVGHAWSKRGLHRPQQHFGLPVSRAPIDGKRYRPGNATCNGLFVGGHDASVLAVHAGDVSFGVAYDDVRQFVLPQYPDIGAGDRVRAHA
jgi:hypothetical protein